MTATDDDIDVRILRHRENFQLYAMPDLCALLAIHNPEASEGTLSALGDRLDKNGGIDWLAYPDGQRGIVSITSRIQYGCDFATLTIRMSEYRRGHQQWTTGTMLPDWRAQAYTVGTEDDPRCLRSLYVARERDVHRFLDATDLATRTRHNGMDGNPFIWIRVDELVAAGIEVRSITSTDREGSNMTQQQHENPFAPSESLPSVSWKDAPVGHTIIAKVIELPSLVQSRDFSTGRLLTWDNGDPKMSVVTNVEVDGVKKGLWCVKPSALYGAIVDALQQAGTDALQVGGLLRVQYVGDKPSKAGNPAKQFHVDYKPPSAFESFGAGNGAGNGAVQPPQQPAPQYEAPQPRYAAPQQPAPGYPPQQDPWGTPQSGQPDPWAGTPKPDDQPPF